MIPNARLTLTQRSFTIRGAASWNLLTDKIKKSTKLGQFKRLVKGWILKIAARIL